MKKLLVLILSLTVFGLTAQQRLVTGQVKDLNSGFEIEYVQILFFSTEDTVQAYSDLEGNFKVSLKNNIPYTYLASSLGYAKKSGEISPDQLTINISLSEETVSLDTITVNSNTEAAALVEEANIGKVDLDIQDVEELPAILGEPDPLKTLQLLPGVQSSGEGNSGLYVRGGGPDQNLVLLDQATVYNTGHLFGFFSVFNTDVIDEVNLYKAGIPAEFGGRVSSVLEFTTQDGNPDSLQVNGSIGLIASRLTISAPIIKDKLSFFVSGRRTYIDLLTRPFNLGDFESGVPYFFYDVNAKIKYEPNENNTLEWSSYLGKDAVTLSFVDGRFVSDIEWGNRTSTLNWTHFFGDKLYLENYLVYNDYSFSVDSDFSGLTTSLNSEVRDIALKPHFTYEWNDKQTLKFGADIILHTLSPRSAEVSSNGQSFDEANPNLTQTGLNIVGYINDEIDFSPKFKANVGLRLNSFGFYGPYNNITDLADTLAVFDRFERVQHYFNFEPRLSLRYKLNEKTSLKGSLEQNVQNIHLLSLSGSSLPFDIWIPSSQDVKPEISQQVSLGYFTSLHKDQLEFSVEGYYKNLENQIEYGEDYVPSFTGEAQEGIVFGEGRSYGVEFLLRKRHGRLNGWIGYTLARSDREFEDINGGEAFPYRFDRRHDLSVVALYDLNDKWTFGTNFVYGTGQAITIQEGRFLIEGTVVGIYGPRNGFRIPSFHRWDLSATRRTVHKEGKWASSWVFSLYNAYNRRNPFVIFTDASGDLTQNELEVSARQIFLFPILPSVTWNFEF